MNRDNRTGPRLFFIEFLIVLFFFLIVSTVCLRLFARAHTITRRADELSHAQTAAASAAAAIESSVADGKATAAENTGSADLAENTGSAPERADTADPAEDSADDAAEALLRAAAGYLPQASVRDHSLFVYYDGDFQPCAQEDASYTLTASVAEENSDYLATIEVQDGRGQLLYRLPAAFHRPVTRKEALR